jgi:hypothetical protein
MGSVGMSSEEECRDGHRERYIYIYSYLRHYDCWLRDIAPALLLLLLLPLPFCDREMARIRSKRSKSSRQIDGQDDLDERAHLHNRWCVYSVHLGIE